jgi:hypothetical protein
MDNEMKSKIISTVAKPLYAGILGASGAYWIYGENAWMVIFGKPVYGWLVIGAGIGLSSYAAEIVDEWLLPHP